MGVCKFVLGFLVLWVLSAPTNTSAFGAESVGQENDFQDKYIVREMTERDLKGIDKIRERNHSRDIDLKPYIENKNLGALVVFKNGKRAGYLLYELQQETLRIAHIEIAQKGNAERLGAMLINSAHKKGRELRKNKTVASLDGSEIQFAQAFQVLGFHEKQLKNGLHDGTELELANQLEGIKILAPYEFHQRIDEAMALDKAGSSVPWSRNDFENFFGGTGFIHGFTIDNKLAGFVAFESTKYGYEIIHFVVHPDLRRQGVGSEILTHMRDRLVTNGKNEIRLVTRASNKEASDFLMHQGYRERERKRKYFKNGEDAIEWRYKLGGERFIAETLKALNHFERLGVSLMSTPVEIRTQFDHIMESIHPDKEVRALLVDSLNTLTNPDSLRAYINNHRESLRANSHLLNRIPFQASPSSPNLYERIGAPQNAQSHHLDGYYNASLLIYGNSARAMKRIHEAMEVLKSPDRKNAYDAILGSTEGISQKLAIQRFLGHPVPELNQESVEIEESRWVGTPLWIHENFYQRLGVAENADQRTITDAYIKAMTRFKDNPSALKKLTEAYHVLNSSQFRSLYDGLLQDQPARITSHLHRLVMAATQVPKQEELTIPIATQVTEANPLHDNYFQRLGIPENATLDIIVEAYERLSLAYKDKPEQFQRILTAYRILRDPLMKKRYQEFRRNPHKKQRQSELALLETHAEDVELSTADKQETDMKFGEIGISHPRAVNYYERLGIPRNATQVAITDEFLRHYLGANDIDRSNYEEAYAMLKTPALRAEYDAYLDNHGNSLTWPILKWRATAYSHLEKLKAALEHSKHDTLTQFVNQTKYLVDGFQYSPRLGKQFVLHLRSKIEYHKGDIQSYEGAVDTLNFLQETYDNVGPIEHMESFVSSALDLRSKLAQRIIDLADTPEKMRHVNALYKNTGPGDIVHQQLEEANKRFGASIDNCGLRLFSN